MSQPYEELGALIQAIGSRRFGHSLLALLQHVFHYDSLLLAMYQVGQPLRVVRSDFRHVNMQSTLHHLMTETYVAEPVYRLFNARQTKGGIYDMSELVQQSLSLPTPVNESLPHLIVDPDEEIGWRTVGWPKHQQETCMLVPLHDQRLIAVSLFNVELERTDPFLSDQLKIFYPTLAAAIARHFELMTVENARLAAPPIATDTHTLAGTSCVPDVHDFFSNRFNVSITEREGTVFTQLLRGDTIAAIADDLCISVYTARTHRRNVYRKIGHGRLLELINQFHAFGQSPVSGIEQLHWANMAGSFSF